MHLIERPYGTFTRHFRLPEDGAGDKLSASYKEGVLTIVLPKREETKPRQVEVEVLVKSHRWFTAGRHCL